MLIQVPVSISSEALVCRNPGFRETSDQYLRMTGDGAAVWTSDPQVATSFPSLREAARAAFRLPAGLKAYGVLRQPEITLLRALH